MKNKQIFVTGGTGYLGSYLLRYLVHQGYTRIRALRRPTSKMDLVDEIADRIEWVEGDVLDYFLLEDCLRDAAVVYHCAAIVSFDPRDRRYMREVNVDGTANVVNAALHHGIEKLIHTSSTSALGRTKDGATLSEDNKWVRSRFNAHYSISKFLAEQEVWRGAAEGLDVAVVNPSIIMGSGRWNEGPLKIYQLVWGEYPFYSTGGNGFVDVRDVARFMLLLQESGITGRRFVLSAENWSFRRLMYTIAAELGKRPPRRPMPAWLRKLAWRVDWLRTKLSGRRPLITRETARNASRTFYFDNRRSREAFDFEYLPLEHTLAESCRQFREAAAEGFPTRVLPLYDPASNSIPFRQNPDAHRRM